MNNRRWAIVPGLMLVLLGAWLLAQNLRVDVPGIDQLWPAIPLVFGIGFLAQYFVGGRHEEGLVFIGVAASLVGGFFLAITLGPLGWEDMGRYWPVFVLIGGVAFLAQWLAQPRERGLLVPAALALIVGLTALSFTLGLANPALADRLSQLWPLLLILAGLALLASYFFQARR